MCTLTFMPDGTGFALVSSRDEAVDRGKMMPPRLLQAKGAICPIDQKSGGTWLMTSEAGYTLNILNGGYVAHKRNIPYKQSRGLLIDQFTQYGKLETFANAFDFEGIEPFTMVCVEHEPLALNSLVWTGEEVHFQAHNIQQPAIWSSATLYTPEAKARRQAWFQTEMETAISPLESLMHFHYHGGEDWSDESERICMKSQDGKQTICIAGIVHNDKVWKFIYHDLLQDIRQSISLVG